jgi:hypothetical protein
MSMGTLLGAALSLILFGISYRQTIGARKERARNANAEMERTLMKRIILEGSDVSPTDLERYLAGKAREHRVRPSALLCHSDLLANVMTRVVDDDFLEGEVRKTVLKRIGSMLDAMESEPAGDEWIPRSEAEPDPARQRTFFLAVMVATTAMIGSFVAVIPTITEESGEGGVAFVAALGASLVLITMVLVFLRLRESDDAEPSRESGLQREARLERQVQRVLKKAEFEEIERPDRGLDFVVKQNGRSVGLELKAWQRPLSRPVLGRIFKSVETAGQRFGVDEVLLVVPDRSPVEANGFGGAFVRVVKVDELEQALLGSQPRQPPA